ncbi:MAG: helix-turn-helix domain-containing protein [Micropruina sp.]|uniref:helix-turn-helix transcriptional regulator n=1 Tax=Micropruina sp. TaxID=2737536 RepID=UPI0039E2B25D
MSVQPTDLITLAAAAETFGVHPRSIRRRIASGDLPGYRFGPRVLRVSRSDVQALLRRIPAAGGAR